MEPSNISSATLQEVLKFGAQEVRMVGCADNIWVRPKFDSLIFYVLEPQADRLGADFFTTRFLWG
jgi:hypothetical protein